MRRQQDRIARADDRARRFGEQQRQGRDLGVVLGGRLGYVLFYNPAYFAAHPADIFTLWRGGMSFHGGFLGTVLALILFAVLVYLLLLGKLRL